MPILVRHPRHPCRTSRLDSRTGLTLSWAFSASELALCSISFPTSHAAHGWVDDSEIDEMDSSMQAWDLHRTLVSGWARYHGCREQVKVSGSCDGSTTRFLKTKFQDEGTRDEGPRDEGSRGQQSQRRD